MSIQNIDTRLWRVVVPLGRDPKTGKIGRIDRRIKGTKADAQAFELECRNSKVAPRKQTYSEYLVTTWLPSLQVEAATIENSYKYGMQYLEPELGNIALCDITPWHIENALNALPPGNKRRRARTVLSASLCAAERWGLIGSNPLRRAKYTIGDGEQKNLDTYSADELNAVLNAFHGHQVEPVVIIMAACGLRKEEAIALNWQDIDLESGMISITKAWARGQGGKPEVKKTKTKKSRRTVYLFGWWLERLREIAPVLNPEQGGSPATQPLWPGKVYDRIRPDAATRAFERQIRRCGLRYLPLNHLRHTHATLALASGEDISLVAADLGQTLVSTTARYIIPQEQSRQAAARKFAQIVKARSVGSKSPGQ